MGGGLLRQPRFLRKSGKKEAPPPSLLRPSVCPQPGAVWPGGAGARIRHGLGPWFTPPRMCYNLPVLSSCAGVHPPAGCPDATGTGCGCCPASGPLLGATGSPRGPILLRTGTAPKQCDAAGSEHPWAPKVGVSAPLWGHPARRPCSSPPPAGSTRCRRRCRRLWTLPASPAQGQRKGLFLFAGAVGSGNTWFCLGAAARCPRAGVGILWRLIQGCAQAAGLRGWVSFVCVAGCFCSERAGSPWGGEHPLTGVNPLSTPPLATPATSGGVCGTGLPAGQSRS